MSWPELPWNTTWDSFMNVTVGTSTVGTTTTAPVTTPDVVTAPVIDPVQGDLSLVINDSITNLNISAVEYVPVVAAGIAFGTLVVIGILSIIAFVCTLIYGRRKINEYPFFIIVFHMTLANTLWVAMVSTTILPLMVANASDTSIPWYNWGARIMDAADNALLYLTLLMTINRFCVFCFPKLTFIFSKLNLMVMCCIVWIYVLFIVYWNVNYGIIRKFDRKKISMQETILGSNPLTQFFTICSTVIPLCMLGMYAIIVIVIVKQRVKATDARKKQDRMLLWQALAITVTLELSKSLSLLTPLIALSTWMAWVWTIFNYSCSIINQIINPILFLTLNQMMRNNFLRMISLGYWKMESSSDDSRKPRQIFVQSTKTAV